MEDVSEVHIEREVVFWTTQLLTRGAYPANYRRVAVTVSAVGRPGVSNRSRW